MAYATINFIQPFSGRLRTAPVGFSWTTLFFGFLPSLLRGHWIGALVQFVLALATMGISGLVFPFIYNKMYIKYLVGDGYKVQSTSRDVDRISESLNLQLPQVNQIM